ncbi:hypothetical protein [Micromonospora sp. WMMC250]|uniref:hypothetical protein n=1 Tax=Micromonospora sp. WMMC250 TaxID=3014781 RepID=UPI0022B660A2|nr:hypothetical protein [Micromonospora sp. WMMC250]MCZ7376515.1 hypothetical protein [Micromonospora sp. WMMC250]
MSALVAVMAVIVAIACAGCWASAEHDRRALSAELTTRTKEAAGYRMQVMRLSARLGATTDDIDSGLVEEITAYLDALPTDDRENPL